MTTSPRALMIGALEFATEELKELSQKFQIENVQSRTRQEFFDDCKGRYKDVTIAALTSDAAAIYGPIDKEFIDNLPKGVKFLVWGAAGYNNVDVDACAARNIYVSHTPGAVDYATADVAVSLILNACRNASMAERNLRQGRFRDGVPMGTDPEGKVLGILGMGGIGKAVAKRMLGFDMKIQYHNRSRLDAEVENQFNATYVDFETLLRTSDILFVSVPLSKATYHLLDTPQFSMMKKGAILVNTARGAVIRESALVRALESGKLLAVGLDVFEEEPEVHPGLLTHPRAVLLPHIGTYTAETTHKMELVVLQNLAAALSQNTLVNPIPEHKQFLAK